MMATDHWDRIEELFQQALDLPQEARRGFLHERCGTDSTLLSELELLLANDLRAGNQFMEPAAQGIRLVGTATDPDRFINQLIGAYRIVRVIARGGMGTVYLAEQAKPKRQVALKILSRGIISQSAERRFEFESQILARLQHPNIAPVHEAGSHRLETGATVQYFAMEYVSDARSLTCFAKERQFKIQDRLRLFLQACDAVHHGHQKGVIHRDLKPGNILVSSDGVVKLIDFGVARATDSDVTATSMHTDIGQLIGTIAYMSPEQCDADPLGLDIRCDVYSLGVVLYELLCGQLPYDVSKTSIFAATKAIKEAQPGRPSTIKGCGTGSQQVKGDLETIVLKCLEKDRAKRYTSASELAADVRRYLNREPISAQPPTHWSRVVRWVLRNPRKATAATCLLIAGLVLVATKVTVLYWAQRPYEVVIASDGKVARLHARSETILNTWRAAEGGVITFGKLFEHTYARDNRGVVILGMSGYADPAIPPGLHFYPSQGRYEQPISIARIASNELPSSVLDTKGDISGQYGVAIARTFDVFPDIPGDEIVAGFTSTFSPSPIRVYTTAGELMFEAWHDGTICDFYFLPSESLLLCAAHSSEAYWAERGQETTKTSNPLVVFAIRPQRGYQSRDYIRGDSSTGAVRCEWYKAVSVKPGAIDQRGMRVPADALIWAGARKAFSAAAAPLNDGHHVQICMGLQPEIYGVGQAGLVWTIDDLGAVIPTATHLNDPYSAAIDMKTVPKPEGFCLNELPPLARGPTSAATRP